MKIKITYEVETFEFIEIYSRLIEGMDSDNDVDLDRVAMTLEAILLHFGAYYEDETPEIRKQMVNLAQVLKEYYS